MSRCSEAFHIITIPVVLYYQQPPVPQFVVHLTPPPVGCEGMASVLISLEAAMPLLLIHL